MSSNLQCRTVLNPNQDYYAILGAREDASRRDIERLYKRQAHQRHPDRGGAEEDMKALNEAYRILHNADLRREYDSQRHRVVGAVSTTSTPAAHNVGLSGQLLSALLCLAL